MLIFLLGSGALTLYQVMSLEDRLDRTTQAIDNLDGKVKRAEYEKGKFFKIARGVLRLAPKDPNADQIAVYYKLKELQGAEPVLMNLDTPSDFVTNAASSQPSSLTNSAPESMSPATNPAPASPAPPASQ